MGIETRVGNSRKGKGKVTYSRPTDKAVQAATQKLKHQVKRIRSVYYRDQVIQEINRFNSIAVGIGNYWSMTSQVTKVGSLVDHRLWYSLDKTFMELTGSKLGEFHKRKIEAEKTSNLPVRHKGYKTRVPYLEYEGCKVGITMIAFNNYITPKPKIPNETPYTHEGRKINSERTLRSMKLLRPDELTMLDKVIKDRVFTSKTVKGKEIYNFEYLMNRGYALNRDKCECKICKTPLLSGNLHTHHKNPYLPIDKINKVNNLVSLCVQCHDFVHNDKENLFKDNSQEYKRLENYRKLVKQKVGA